jgi:hypothetical protein
LTLSSIKADKNGQGCLKTDKKLWYIIKASGGKAPDGNEEKVDSRNFTVYNKKLSAEKAEDEIVDKKSKR